ncbi:hypothetical protein EMIHUDRAFT_452000 [Emiliania huxleyi CCMP1516]|uniref:Secreted protein n=2 Tax=Emiliania huxleyi TaxID=2903 RepID=A0A0D3IQQ5_EMIH1|nr:hypothetical protein EMIHUDRAFT_452000 [Emiliania huxleyi CCMP1516]EOD13590.1 hypothetical protein EMIHUDRAFT_452000 [Emiliania huxleyi CCMP1516]|eukprot:XP_005766019.1 hypothetical protein EMIHUDRAFT_452000 [Emiliania huxleyi CCMP1516]
MYGTIVHAVVPFSTALESLRGTLGPSTRQRRTAPPLTRLSATAWCLSLCHSWAPGHAVQRCLTRVSRSRRQRRRLSRGRDSWRVAVVSRHALGCRRAP